MNPPGSTLKHIHQMEPWPFYACGIWLVGYSIPKGRIAPAYWEKDSRDNHRARNYDWQPLWFILENANRSTINVNGRRGWLCFCKITNYENTDKPIVFSRSTVLRMEMPIHRKIERPARLQRHSNGCHSIGQTGQKGDKYCCQPLQGWPSPHNSPSAFHTMKSVARNIRTEMSRPA